MILPDNTSHGAAKGPIIHEHYDIQGADSDLSRRPMVVPCSWEGLTWACFAVLSGKVWSSVWLLSRIESSDRIFIGRSIQV